MTNLGYLGGFRWSPRSVATDVSSDGSVVVGTSDGQAFRWTEATGMHGLGFYGGDLKISGDGNVIAGWKDAEPFRYTSDLGLMPLGHPEPTANNGGTISALTNAQRSSGVSSFAAPDVRPLRFPQSEHASCRM